ncbi:ammonia-dependent NAD(+) synthetase [Corticicoccus populi]|uniref:NH(3)-dependent NAD(+) synthetase n=1 Tax=Corticicoccus populi TaxID=1812821 RepID=A0ABW5WZP2_9STAP
MNRVQQSIINELHVKPSVNPEEEIREIIDFIKSYLTEHPFIKSVVLGISGGQDSTLLGKLTQTAVNELNSEGGTLEFHAVRLPYGKQQDESDAEDALRFIQPTRSAVIDIKPAVDQSVETLKHAGYDLSDFIKGNEKARERMKVQYAIAAASNGIVFGTDHAAEAVTGFFTKHGDGACDVTPLFGLNKRQGRALLEYLQAPVHLYEKVPTADLESDRPLLSDEEALGVTYHAIDDFLEGKKVSDEDAETIVSWYMKTAHKRTTPYSRYHLPE